jgi:hypothetical protein
MTPQEQFIGGDEGSPDRVWMLEPEYRFHVALGEGVEEVTYDLHVLLRHRLLPQPHGFEGLCVV